MNTQRKRLPVYLFDLPVHELRRGYRSDIYFWREKRTLETHDLHPRTTMQVFQKKESILCGVDESLAVLKLASGRYEDYPLAYRLFDKLIELKRDARRHYLTHKSAFIDIMEQKQEVARQLDQLWQDGYPELEIVEREVEIIHGI